jgi:hypothetical protein
MFKDRQTEPPARNFTPTLAETDTIANAGVGVQVCALDGTHFAVSSFDPGGALTLYTYSCDADGTNITQIDSIVVANPVAQNLCLERIKPGYLVLSYISNTNPFPTPIATYSYNTGTFDSLAAVDSYTLGNIWEFTDIAIIDDTHFLVANKVSGENYVYSFSVDGFGDSITLIDTLMHETTQAKASSIVLLDSTHFAISWGHISNAGKVATFAIDGGFNLSLLDEYEHGAGLNNGTGVSIIAPCAGNYVLLSMQGTTNAKIEGHSYDGSYNITEVDEVTPNNPGTANSIGYRGGDLAGIDLCHFLGFWYESDRDIFVESHKFDGVSMTPVAGGFLQIAAADTKAGQGTHIRAAKLSTTLAVMVYNNNTDFAIINTISTD